MFIDFKNIITLFKRFNFINLLKNNIFRNVYTFLMPFIIGDY